MEESLYHKIREDTMNDKSIHSNFVKLIESIGEQKLEDSHFPVESGVALPLFMYKEHLKTLEKIRNLNYFNKFSEEYMNRYESDLTRSAIQN
jgi:hypothetical protein